jgi:capsular polysaccharide biosynthesis protein
VSPRLPIAVLLSLLIGTVHGLAVIWVLDIVDDRFETPEELKLHLETQVLSMIPRHDRAAG